MRKGVLLVDLSWILYRSHYSFNHLDNGHVYGTLRTIASLREAVDFPIILCIDKRPKAKLAVAPHYKDNRPERFNVHAATNDVISIAAGADRVYFSYLEDTEADDVMAYWAMTVAYEAILFSGDDDLLQITDERVRVARVVDKGKLELLSDDRTLIKYGVEPRHLAMWKVIARDSSDNLIGIPRFPRDILKSLCWKYERPHNLVECRKEVMQEFGTTPARVKYLVELYRLLPHMISMYDSVVHLPTIVSKMKEPYLKKGVFESRILDKYRLGKVIRDSFKG